MSATWKQVTQGMTLETLAKRLSQTAETCVSVGITGNQIHPVTGKSLAEIARDNEFGVPELNIPERSFLRRAVEDNLSALATEMNEAIASTLSGDDSVASAYAEVGKLLSSWSRSLITSDAITPKTVKKTLVLRSNRKRLPSTSNKPMLDTGALVAAIDYEVSEND